MFRKSTLSMLVAVAVSVIGAMDSAEAHFGLRGGGGGRRGGGALQRARQGGNTNGYRSNGNAGVASRPAPAPQAKPTQPAAPAVVQNKPAVTSSVNKPTAPQPAPAPVATIAPAAEAPPAPSAPVAVASKEPRLPQVPVGATLTLNGKDLSDKAGQVVLQVGDIAVPVTIKEWKNDAVVCTLPILGLTKASRATLHVLKADGTSASSMNLELVTALPTLADNNPSLTDSASIGR